MSSTKSCTSLTSYCINFINKDNTWCIFLSLLEEIADTGSTNTYEHFHKI